MTINRWCARSDKYGRYESTKYSTAAHLAKKDREAHSHGGKPGGTGRPLQSAVASPDFEGREAEGRGARGARKQERNDVYIPHSSTVQYLTL